MLLPVYAATMGQFDCKVSHFRGCFYLLFTFAAKVEMTYEHDFCLFCLILISCLVVLDEQITGGIIADAVSVVFGCGAAWVLFPEVQYTASSRYCYRGTPQAMRSRWGSNLIIHRITDINHPQMPIISGYKYRKTPPSPFFLFILSS